MEIMKATDFPVHENEESADELVVGNKNKKRLLKKAPDAPKRFKSAYICYVMDMMDEIKGEYAGEIKATELMKKLAVMWQDLPIADRRKHEETAQADKARYSEEMARYTGPMHVPNKRVKKPQGAPKRAISAFLSFSQLMRSEIRAQYPNLKNTDVSSVLAQKWHEASEEVKRPHIERELRDREKYHQDMALWKEGESDRIESDKSCRLAQSGAKQGSPLQLGYLNQTPSSSLWAAMIDVNGVSSFDTGLTGPPLYDEAMVGFWDTDMEGGDNQFGCSTGSEKSSDKGEKSEKNAVSSRFSSFVARNPSFHAGSSAKEIKREITLTTSKKSKQEKLARRAKGQRSPSHSSSLSSSSSSLSFPSSNSQQDLPLNAQQLEIQQRRLQQQHQYQMYQQHLLKQKAKAEVQDPIHPSHSSHPSHPSHPPHPSHPSHSSHGSHPLHGSPRGDSSRPMSSANSIMAGGRLHSHQASQRNAEDAHQKLSSYQGTQGTQRNTPKNMSLPWPAGLSGFAGSMSQLYPPGGPSNHYGQPYGTDPYYAPQYPPVGYGYGLIDGIESYFFDSPAVAQENVPQNPQNGSQNVPQNGPQFQAQGQSQGQGQGGEGYRSGLSASKSMTAMSAMNESKGTAPVDNSNSNNSNSNSNKMGGDTSMRSFQFDEQDRFCVMQTLMAVHRASASKAGDSETLRSLDRIQMVQQEGEDQKQQQQQQQQQQSKQQQQIHGQQSQQSHPTQQSQQSQQGLIKKQEHREQDPQGDRDRSSRPSGEHSPRATEHSPRSASSGPSGSSGLGLGSGVGSKGADYCAPLSFQQQERQNLIERQQLKDRQMKQMQEMLQLQEREQVKQKEEHVSSMVSASADRVKERTERTALTSPYTGNDDRSERSDDCYEEGDGCSNPDESSGTCKSNLKMINMS